jgi:bidirectional [NiFe] hydrogenase diaphorase subunit
MNALSRRPARVLEGEPRISFTLDGRTVEAPTGAPLLRVAQALGVEIPSLCDHPDLEPVGACRLCLCEVTHPDWKGWSGLMTACLYPVAEGIVVSTRSAAVLEARRRTLSLLAARCPASEVVQALARKHGARTDLLLVDPEADACILCGLCTRICEATSTSAITTFGRGTHKDIAGFARRAPDECVLCGACASVCPTGNLRLERVSEGYRIWDRTVPVAVCTVDARRCIACGACEEACPFSVARVMLRAGGGRFAAIAESACRGCGVCVGACPTGAISQQGCGLEDLVRLAAGKGGPA